MKLSSALNNQAFILLFLTIAGLGLYAMTLNDSFHFDDFRVIVHNPAIRDLSHIQEIYNTFNARFFVGVSFAFNYALHRFDVFGYHLFNIFVHILTAFCVYKLSRVIFLTPKMKGNKLSAHKQFIALFASLIFLTHPLQTQAVSYVWQRATSLCALFYISAIIAYIKYRVSGKNVYYCLGLLLMATAMMTKEIAVTLPAILLLVEYMFFREKITSGRAFKFFPYLMGIMIIPLLLRHSTLDTMGITQSAYLKFDTHNRSWEDRSVDITRGAQTEHISRKNYFLTQCHVLRRYMSLIVWPQGQNLDYDFPQSTSLKDPRSIFGLLFIVAVISGGFWLFRKNIFLLFGFLWFFVTISVESSVIPILDLINEHRVYLPMAGASLLLASLGSIFVHKISTRNILAGGIIIVLSALTLNRNPVWHDDITLWSDVVQKAPGKSRAHTNLAVAYMNENRLHDAFAEIHRALTMDPDNPQIHYNLGRIQEKMNLIDQAAASYGQTLKKHPYAKDTRFALASLLLGRGRYDAAEEHFKNLISYYAKYADAYVGLGIIRAKNGKLDEAKEYLKKAIQLDPENAKAYHNLGIVYGREGKAEDEIRMQKKAVGIDPHYFNALKALGLTYEKKQDYAAADEIYQTIIDHTHKKDFGYHRRGVLAALAGKNKAAEGYFSRAFLSAPDNPDIIYDAAIFYNANGDGIKTQNLIERLKKLGRADLAAEFYSGGSVK